jgi:transposase
MLTKGFSFQFVAELWCTSERTLYNWLYGFLAQGMDSFHIVKRSGRPSSLTRDQKEILKDIIDAGPEKYGFSVACWNSAMIKEVIQKEFKVSYNRHYVCALLRNLGYSYQKGKFTPDKADLLERELWSTKTWPEILVEAKASNTALLFVDEARMDTNKHELLLKEEVFQIVGSAMEVLNILLGH